MGLVVTNTMALPKKLDQSKKNLYRINRKRVIFLWFLRSWTVVSTVVVHREYCRARYGEHIQLQFRSIHQCAGFNFTHYLNFLLDIKYLMSKLFLFY